MKSNLLRTLIHVFALCIFTVSCAHTTENNFDRHLASLQCEEAFKSVPQLQISEQARSSAEWATKNTMAYTYVGLNYTAEVLWDVSVGAAVIVALCAPAVVASMASRPLYVPQYQNTSYCIPTGIPLKNVMSPPLGKKAINDTHDMRCPNVEPLALSLERVAACYANRNTPEDVVRALKTLEGVENSEHFFSCITPETQERIKNKRISLQILKTSNSDF